MHNAALREMGEDGVYVPFDVSPEGLADAIRGLRALGIGGVNCTIPHKEALLKLLDEIDEEASLIGAVNTIVFCEDRTVGYNTDAPGFLADLRAQGFEPERKQAVVLGAGGSARAIVVALARLGAPVTIANRTEARARELAEELSAKIPGSRIIGVGQDEALLERALDGTELLVNTTSVGMSPRASEMPPLPEKALGPGLFVYDLIYNPLETRLLRAARERGASTANGAGMLAHQGALALGLWTGRAAPVRLMEQVVVETLRQRELQA